MRKATHSVPQSPSWRPLRPCVESGCLEYAAFDRKDGRCYWHAKLADGLTTLPDPHPHTVRAQARRGSRAQARRGSPRQATALA